MFLRNRFLMNAASETPPASVPAATPAAPAAPASEPTFNNMSAEAFKARLEEAAASGQKSFLKSIGFQSQEEVKQALAQYKEMQDAKLSAEEKTKKQIDELTPRAARATKLEEMHTELLKEIEGQIPEDKRGMLDLAPSDPTERLLWITKAQAKGLFSAATPPAPAPKNPATTGGAPGPSPSAPAPGKSAFQQWQEQNAQDPVLGALFYQRNSKAIEASKPQQ